MRLLRRVWDSPRLIPVLSVLTVIALAAAAFAVFGVLAGDRERERDRIAVDAAACERGNVLRVQVVDIGNANEELVEGVVDVVLSFVSNVETVDGIRRQIEPVLEQHRMAVDAIELVDCRRVVPGTAPKENP